MAAKIPTTGTYTDRIALVQQQAVEALRLLDERATELRLGEANDQATNRCREIAVGAPVEFRDEYTVGMLLNSIKHRLHIGL